MKLRIALAAIATGVLAFAAASGSAAASSPELPVTGQEPSKTKKPPAFYWVKPQDTLWKIASHNNVSLADLIRSNNVLNPDVIAAGMKLFLPPPVSPEYQRYTVQPGDTVAKVAAQFSTTIKRIYAHNDGLYRNPSLSVGHTLLVGQGPEKICQSENLCSQTYAVMPGDTVTRIAARAGVSLSDLVRINHLKDANNLYAGQTLIIRTQQGQSDNPSAETKRRIFSAQKLAFASIKDSLVSASQPVVYYLDESNNRLVSLNYETGETHEAALRNRGEKLVLVPGTEEIVVAETVQGHSSYWWDENQSGTVEVFDAKNLALKGTIDVQTDPYDIAADSKGFVYISSGSGQWTKLSSYSLKTKSLVDTRQIRQQSRIVLSLDESKLYTVNSDTSPRDMAAYLIKDGKFTESYDSPYHGDHPMGTVNWLSPDGKLILNSAGTVFQTATGRSGDMEYVTKVNNSFQAFAAYDGTFFTAADNVVHVYQADRLIEIKSFKAAGSILNLWSRDRELVILIRVVPEGSNRPQNVLEIIQL